MKASQTRKKPLRPGFTLVELLVVMAVITVLAALIIPLTAKSKTTRTLAKAQTELNRVELGIAAYQAKLGHYPPDNPDNPALNQLYYELQGTVFTNGVYQTLDGSGKIAQADFPPLFGPRVSGFANASKASVASDNVSVAETFLKGLRPNQIGELSTAGQRLLVCSVPWPDAASQPVQVPPARENGLNPWRYVSTNPTHNSGSFDLWVDIRIGGKTYRISNWSRTPQVL
jgi:prepilin-type N-terminal cleavage/methylation domain-containing protein